MVAASMAVICLLSSEVEITTFFALASFMVQPPVRLTVWQFDPSLILGPKGYHSLQPQLVCLSEIHLEALGSKKQTPFQHLILFF